ncbi:MAG TPA: alpha/beta fold hydrolase [Burkholderiales bacterium]|nr:alpha/beta fold hydrolase [Burkholderiales bacterium]
MNQQVRFCISSDGVRLAYATSGSGPPLVRAPHWFTHLEHDWNNPAMKPWSAGLSRGYSLLRFDQRGTGLSDRDVPVPTWKCHVEDLASVVDAARFDRFALLGLSQGAAFAIDYAATHPERVSHLIICGGFVRGRKARGGSDEETETLQRLIELGWGRDDPSFRQVFTTRFMPDAGLDAIHAFNDMMPLTASAQMAGRLHRANLHLDAREQASRVQCPTLVLHARGDLSIPFEEGRLIAGLIPGARFVTLESRNHLLTESEPAWRDFLAAMAGFYPPAGAAPGAGFPGLTPRETEVLELIAQGLDNAQIAARLELSEKTVRNNITHIFDKIQVENRSQAIVRARDAGLGAKPAK